MKMFILTNGIDTNKIHRILRSMLYVRIALIRLWLSQKRIPMSRKVPKLMFNLELIWWQMRFQSTKRSLKSYRLTKREKNRYLRNWKSLMNRWIYKRRSSRHWENYKLRLKNRNLNIGRKLSISKSLYSCWMRRRVQQLLSRESYRMS